MSVESFNFKLANVLIDFHFINFLISDTFWVRLSAIGECEELGIEQFAVLTYASQFANINLAFTNKIPPASSEKFPDGVVSASIYSISLGRLVYWLNAHFDWMVVDLTGIADIFQWKL